MEETTMAGRLRLARDRAFLSQRELAGRSGVNEITISRIERGVIVAPYASTIRKLAMVLMVEPKWLRYGDG